MKIAVTSGKGGTGKTTISTMLAYAAQNAQYIDCDAEEPNGHIFLKPTIEKEISFTLPVPQINTDICTFCEKCSNACVYKALVIVPQIKKVMFFEELCHSCGTCAYVCPEEGALIEVDKEIGKIQFGRSGNISFVSGILNIKEASATQLINRLKTYIDDSKTVVLDSPPGTSCTVVATLEDTDFAILVTEPTPFGLSDLKLAVELVRNLRIPFGIIVNKHDDSVDIIEQYAKEENIEILYRLYFSEEFARDYSKGVLPFEKYKDDFRKILKTVEDMI